MAEHPPAPDAPIGAPHLRFDPKARIAARGLNVWYGNVHALVDVALDVPAGGITALVGTSGCGKTTFLRCTNRLIDTVRGARVSGVLTLDGRNVRDRTLPLRRLRGRFGVVAQAPDPFPTTIRENVAYGPRLHALARDRAHMDSIVRRSLERVGLWDEVSDDLGARPGTLSLGQQRRLCMARALAYAPEVLLLDEPSAALDPDAARRIERLVGELAGYHTVLLATHHLGLVRRVAHRVALFHRGRVIETGPTEELFGSPREETTRAYLTGRIG